MEVIKWVTHKEKATKKVHKGKEKLTEKDIEELMGMNMPTYKRNRGAIKQK